MNISHREFTPGIHLVTFNGPLTTAQKETTVEFFRNLSGQGVEGVVVNLETVPFIDSRGLAALIRGYQIFGSEPQNFRLAGPQDQLKILFELTGFARIFFIHDSVAEVIAAEPEPVAVLEAA